MSRLPAFHELLQDVFNLLLFLRGRDVKLRGEWFLPSTSLYQCVPLVLSDDRCAIPSLRQDLPMQRVRFVLFLAHSAGLVAATSSPRGKLLKPSAYAMAWINSPLSQRVAILAQAFLSDNTTSTLIWARLRLPGWRVVKAGLSQPRPFRFGDIQSALLHPQHPQRTLSQNILSLLPIVIEPRIKDVDARTPTLLNAILTVLCWFGLIRPTTLTRARSTPALLRTTPLQQPVNSTPEETPLSLVLDHPHHHALYGLQLVESKPAAWPMLFDLARITKLVEARPRAFTLDHALVLRAFDEGLSVNAVHTLLERATADALPHAVSLLLRRWHSEHERVQLRAAVILQVDFPVLLDQILQHRDLRRKLRRLSPDTAELRSGDIDSLARRLKRLGIYGHNLLPAGIPHAQMDGFSPAEWALIYQALELSQRLPDLVSPLSTTGMLTLGAIAPHALIQSVASRLEPAQANAIRVAVEEQVHRAQAHMRYAALLLPDDGASSRVIRDRLEQAIATGAWVRLTYYAAGNAEVTQRDVQPRRIEWRGAVSYLIAWCNLRRDERTFRIDRIMALDDPASDAPPLHQS